MATRVILNGNGYQGMRINSKPPSILSDDDDGVQSGSATGFSDEHEDISGSNLQPMHLKKPNMAFDPVTQILDKIDAELSSLTRSQASSSTATDSTIVRCPASLMSTESGSRLDNGDSLTMSQLGSSLKPTFSPISSGSRPPGSIDRDTGIGTATSSFNTDRQRSRSVEAKRVLDLEPGDAFKAKSTRPLSPDFSYLNGHHIGQSDDDKSKQEQQASSAPFEAKHVDEKFKEIMQKRRGMSRAGTDDDNQTIRTEDFVEKFQDTMVYSSADEAEKIRNLEDDLHSDGGSDTDTLQQKLAMLSRTSLPTKDGRSSPCPAPRPLDRPRRRIAQSFEGKLKKVGGPGTPPVYPKPTPTASLPRPSTRSSLKLAPGNTSDADSVRTEDFENRFKDMLIMGKERETGESDLDGGMTSDPIHTKVKELLKATAKYDVKPAPFTTSILKSRYKTLSDKPKPELKPKPHVRISPKLPQYQDQQEKGDDSDDTLCSDKDNRVASPRSWSGWFWRQNPNGPGLIQDHAATHPLYTSQVSNSSSLDDSLSKSSLSASSVSSSDKEKHTQQRSEDNNINKQRFLKETNAYGFDFSRQVSQISSADSSYSDYSQNNSRSESTSESLVDDELSYLHALYLRGADRSSAFPGYQSSQFSGALRRRSISEVISNGPYIYKKYGNETMKKDKKQEKKPRDLIVQDEEEEEFPFSKYTFNKKTNSSSKSEDSSSARSSTSQRSTSRDSICSTGVMSQFLHLRKGNKRLLQNSLSSNSLFSTLSSLNDTSGSTDEFSSHFENNSFDTKHRQPSFYRSQMSSGPGLFPQNSLQQDRSNYPMSSHGCMSASPTYPSSNMEQVLSNLGVNLPSSLPERFLKSLVDKLYVSQQEEMVRQMVPPFVSTNYPREHYSYPEDQDLPPSVSAQHSGASTPMWRQSFETLSNPPADSLARMKRQQLHRANTINNSASFSQASSCHKDSQDEHGKDNLFSQVGPLPLQKENSFDKLKRILQSTDKIQHHRERDARRTMYGLNRQKSLPLFLETLSEEEEERRRSRTPSFDKSKGTVNISSKLRSLHEDPERSCSAKSSEDTSDASRRSSLNQNTAVTDTLLSVKKSLSSIDNDGDSSCTNDHFNDDGQHKPAKKHDAHQNVPCILVTGRDTDNPYEICNETEVSLFDSETEKLLQHGIYNYSVDRKNASRPKSPTPEGNEGNGDEGFASKDSLEIAEILSPSDKKVPVISLLSKIDSFSENEKSSPQFVMPCATFKYDDSNKYLKISDFDDRHLSHTPSTASPISPITVIDMAKLDNQLESCEMEDICRSNDTASASDKVSMKFGDNKSNHSANGHDSKTSDTSVNKSNNHHVGTSNLTLERRSYYAELISDSDKNTSEEQFEADSEQQQYDERSVQASLEPLTPLMSVSELSRMLQHLFRKFPQRGENMFYLAQDKEVQCNITKNSAECPHCCCNKQDIGVANMLSKQKRDTSTTVASVKKSDTRMPTQEYTNTTDGAFRYKVTVSTDDLGSLETNKNCTYKTFTSYEKKKPFLLNLDNVRHIQDKPTTNPMTFRSEAFFILKQSSEDSDIGKVAYKAPKQTEHFLDNQNNCSVKIKKSKQAKFNKGGKGNPNICQIVTEVVDDIHKDIIVACNQEEEEAGFEEMVSSYVNYCKQTVTEGTCELKSPNSLTVERFEYEPWDTLDLRKVLDVFEKNIATEDDNGHSVCNIEKSKGISVVPRDEVDDTDTNNKNKSDDEVKHQANKNSMKEFDREDSDMGNDLPVIMLHKDKVTYAKPNHGKIKDVGQVPFKPMSLSKCTEKVASDCVEDVYRLPSKTRDTCEPFGNKSNNQSVPNVNEDSDQRYTSKASLTLEGLSDKCCRSKTRMVVSPDLQSTRNLTSIVDTDIKSVNNSPETPRDRDGHESFTSTLYFNFGNDTAHKSVKNKSMTKSVNDGWNNEFLNGNCIDNSGKLSKTLVMNEKNSSKSNTGIENRKTTSSYHMSSESYISSFTFSSDKHPEGRVLNDAYKPVFNNKGYVDNCDMNKQTHNAYESNDSSRKNYDSVYDKDPNESPNMRNDEMLSDRLSSRSVDFDSHDSRKHILKRCNKTKFSKSFDMYGSFYNSDFKDLSETSNTRSVSNIKDELADHALEKLNESFLHFESTEEHIDEGGDGRSGTRSVQYQIGVKEDEYGEVCDVYGRIRIVNSDTEECQQAHNNDDESVYNGDNKQDTSNAVFDIFAQIDEDEEVVRDLNHTDITMHELEKLYKLSVDDDYMSDNKTALTDISQRLSFSSILEELDHEMSQMEAYQTRFQYYESHVCRNCGHTVSITTTERSQGQIEHDFCRECSPLDLTAEMLERRRLEKMMKTSIDHNDKC